MQTSEGGNGDEDFEDRFLQCFGLVDPISSTGHSASEVHIEDREQRLKKQSENSPW